MSDRYLNDEENDGRVEGEKDLFSFSGDTFISKQQGSSMFGGLLTLSQLEALKTWREVEEEKEEDSQSIQEKEEDMNEQLLRIFGVGEGWKNLASREGHRNEEERDGDDDDDDDKENNRGGDSRRSRREREEDGGGEQERGGRSSREGGPDRRRRGEEGKGEREGRKERCSERGPDEEDGGMGMENTREGEEEEEEEEKRDPMAWVIISECHFDDTVDLRLLESIFSSKREHLHHRDVEDTLECTHTDLKREDDVRHVHTDS